MRRNLQIAIFAILGALSSAGCLGDRPSSTPPGGDDVFAGGGSAASGTDNTFDHEMDNRDPFDILKQRQDEGTPEVSARLHSCQKLPFESLGLVLASRGVNLDAVAAAGAPPTAGQLYKAGGAALGAPNYGSRVGEAIESTTAGATKLFEIFVQAAPEIVAAMPSLAACNVGGQAARMFDDAGSCTQQGISCLIGAPALPAQVALCNQLVASASSRDIGQRVAVATILAAAHTCQ